MVSEERECRIGDHGCFETRADRRQRTKPEAFADFDS